MKTIVGKLKQSRLGKRILKLGLVYVALELVIAIGAIIFVAEKVTT